MNLNKLKVFGKLQDQVMELTEGKIPLVTFYQKGHGVTIHNPFLDVTGRFEVDPVKEYGEENLMVLEAKIKEIEMNMGCPVEEMEASDLRLYLAAKFYQGKEPGIEVFEKMFFDDEPMFMKQDEESKVDDVLNFYISSWPGYEEAVSDGALAHFPMDPDKQLLMYANYNILNKEVSIEWTCYGKSGNVHVAKEVSDLLISDMDAYVKSLGEESLEKMVSEQVNEQIWDALEEAVQREWYARPDENGNYSIELSADRNETNKFLLKDAYDNRDSVKLRNGITDAILESYEETISDYEYELLDKAGFDTDSPYHEQAKEMMWERISFSPDFDHFMKDDMRANLLLGTDWERNVEFTDIKHNLARWIDKESFAEMQDDAKKYGSELSEPDNALLWLVRQQGYSLEDLKGVYGEYKAFIEDNYYPNGSPKGLKATNIDWDVDCEEDRDFLPTEIEIPEGMTDEEEISDYISDETGFCHNGFTLEGTDISYDEKIKVLNEKHGTFLVSVCEAIDNQTYSMGCVTVLMKSSLEEYCELFERSEESKELVPKEIVIPKDAYLTLHNPWDGAGCMGWIELEKDLVVPNSMIFDSEIEGVKRDHGWTVDSISGLVRSCWKESKGVRDVQKEIEKPSLDAMIHGTLGRTGKNRCKEVSKGIDKEIER